MCACMPAHQAIAWTCATEAMILRKILIREMAGTQVHKADTMCPPTPLKNVHLAMEDRPCTWAILHGNNFPHCSCSVPADLWSADPPMPGEQAEHSISRVERPSWPPSECSGHIGGPAARPTVRCAGSSGLDPPRFLMAEPVGPGVNDLRQDFQGFRQPGAGPVEVLVAVGDVHPA